jgi:hypothetical protein
VQLHLQTVPTKVVISTSRRRPSSHERSLHRTLSVTEERGEAACERPQEEGISSKLLLNKDPHAALPLCLYPLVSKVSSGVSGLTGKTLVEIYQWLPFSHYQALYLKCLVFFQNDKVPFWG